MRLGRVLAVVLALASAAACSAGPPNRPATGGNFADATCADLANWATTIQRAIRDLQSVQQFDPSAGTTTEAGQLRQLSLGLSDADRATQRLADGINSRRAPDIENGEQVKKTIVDALNELRDLGKKARASIDAYDPEKATRDDAAKLKTDLKGLGDGVENTLAQLTPLVSTNEQLRSALQNSATCQRAASDLLTGSS